MGGPRKEYPGNTFQLPKVHQGLSLLRGLKFLFMPLLLVLGFIGNFVLTTNYFTILDNNAELKLYIDAPTRQKQNRGIAATVSDRKTTPPRQTLESREQSASSPGVVRHRDHHQQQQSPVAAEEEQRTNDGMARSVSIIQENKVPSALKLDGSKLTVIKEDSSANCCHLKAHQKHRNQKRKPPGTCTAMCFTPTACDDELFPFSNQTEKNFFQGIKDTRNATELVEWKLNMRIQCLNHKAQDYKPSNRWNTTAAFPFENHGLPPTGCSVVSGGAAGAFQNLFVIPSAKLAFCGIPKVGITNWLQFIRFVMGAHDYSSFPHGKPDLHLWAFDQLEPNVQQSIWNDSEWTFAAFLRNPAERLLSGYLDKLKVEKKNGMIAKKLGFNSSFTFDAFVERLGRGLPDDDLDCADKDLMPSVTGISWCTDPHWRPQTWSCGMSEKIDRFDFIGSLDRAQEHSKALLEKVGLWESYGKYYRNGKSKRTKRMDPCSQLFPLDDEFETTPQSQKQSGFQQRTTKHNHERNRKGEPKLSWDVIGHAKDSGTKMDFYYTPELHTTVKEKLYKADFQVWEFLDNENGDWVSGKDILSHLLQHNAQQETK